MQKLENSSSAFALYKYGEIDLDGARFEAFYAAFVDVLSRTGLKPTYIGIGGAGYKGRFTKAGGKSHRRLLESRFSGIDTLTLTVNPQGSTEPAYDSFANISVSIIREAGELLLYFVADEAFMPFNSEIFDSVVDQLTRLHDWSFGYGFKTPSSRKPDFYILGLDPGNLTGEQRQALIAWYASSPENRLKHLRNVYSLNVLSSAQLAQTLPGGQTLREFIEREPDSKVEMLADTNLALWKLSSDSAVLSARRSLQQAGICIELPATAAAHS